MIVAQADQPHHQANWTDWRFRDERAEDQWNVVSFVQLLSQNQQHYLPSAQLLYSLPWASLLFELCKLAFEAPKIRGFEQTYAELQLAGRKADAPNCQSWLFVASP